MALKELDWSWVQIACTLMWRFAPMGCVVRRQDLKLPEDLVLVENREPAYIRLYWATLEEAQKMSTPIIVGTPPKASVSELQGRWQKLACVLMWKFAKDGITLRPKDLDLVPADKTLLAHGHAQDIEYRFTTHAEARRIVAWEAEQEGRIVMERGA
jgi:hypothetical protein